MLVCEIKDNELLRQFEIKTDLGLITIEYAIQERKIFLTKLLKNENENVEVVNNFIANVLEIAQERKFKVVPTNSNIVSFFKKNKKYQNLLPPGIKI